MTRPRLSGEFWAGARAISPLFPASFVFGLAYGAVVYDSVVNPIVGAGSYFAMVAGASQFVMIQLFNAAAPAVVVLGAALLINTRFALYSAALGPLYGPFPRRWKVALAFLMTDQAAAISLRHADHYPDPELRRRFFFGASLPFISFSWVGTVIGVAVGPILPESWEIGFIVPLMFIALLIPALRDAPSVVAALVSVGTVVVARGLPSGTGIILGALAGIAIGMLIPHRVPADTRTEAEREAAAEAWLGEDDA
jgi:predicted branched-subunit amino acid permease